MTIFSDYKRIISKIPHDQRKKYSLILILVFLSVLADIFSIASILPYLLILTKPTLIDSNILFTKLFELSGAGTVQQFQIICLIVLLVIFIFKNLFVLFVNHVQNQFVYHVATRLSELQIRNYVSFNYADTVQHNSNLIANNSMTIPTAFAHGILNPLISLTTESLTLFLIFVIISVYNFPLLMVILGILLPVIYLSYGVTKDKVKQLGKERNDLLPVTYANLQEMINGYIELKLYNKTEHFIKRFVKGQSLLHKKQAKMHFLNSVPPRVIETSAIIAILIFSIYFRLTGGSLYSFYLSFGVFGVAIYRLIPSFNRILNSLLVIQNNIFVLDKLEFSKEPKVVRNQNTYPENNLNFSKIIHFKNVSYTYPGSDEVIFNGLDISISKGKITGLAGKSGDGKTTFIYLLSGIIQPDSGNIYVDDQEVNENQIPQWQHHIGFVRHNNFFIDGTIIENITLCSDEKDIDKLQLDKAIKMASLTSLIDSIPEGIHARLGESGIKLSEGQKQRIAIARCIYKDSSVIIFDEATSAIDISTETSILDNLIELKNIGKTIIIISHKPSTLRICDDLLFVKGQKIEKAESPTEFLKNLQSL